MTKKYKNLINPTSQDSEDWKNTLSKAWEIRNFEIDLFWKRTGYFSVLVGALFIAYYTIVGQNSPTNNQEFYKIIISFLGFMASLVWFLSNKGSKFWQENWELHIDYIEKISEQNKIHSLVLSKNNKRLDLLGAYEFSVSKLNTLFSFIVSLAWLEILICNIVSIFELKCWQYIAGFGFIILITISIFLLIRSCKSSFRGYSKGFVDENDSFIESEKSKEESNLKFYQKK
jgi:hypothetical protein